MMEKRQLLEHMIKELEHPAKQLTQWELGFLESVADQLTHKGFLSDKQQKLLEGIYADKTA